jgi:hypothetical protein
MAIPESQLDTWARQGSITQSSDTYATVRRALEAEGTGYADKGYSIFLQGSYGNDTNVYAESDVDVVIQLSSLYFHEFEDETPQEQKDVVQRDFTLATYQYPQYKADVVAALQRRFGSDVTVGNKAVTIAANGNRRKSDVIVAADFRRYYPAPTYAISKYYPAPAPLYHEGICFFTPSGEQIVNFPKQHSDNLTVKHQLTQGWFKPTARILKNLRNRLVADGTLQSGVAPSYFLEGMLYNVPSQAFGQSYQSTLLECMNWLVSTDKSQLVCANERYYLVRDHSRNCWPNDNYDQFLSVLVRTWNNWS